MCRDSQLQMRRDSQLQMRRDLQLQMLRDLPLQIRRDLKLQMLRDLVTAAICSPDKMNPCDMDLDIPHWTLQTAFVSGDLEAG